MPERAVRGAGRGAKEVAGATTLRAQGENCTCNLPGRRVRLPSVQDDAGYRASCCYAEQTPGDQGQKKRRVPLREGARITQ